MKSIIKTAILSAFLIFYCSTNNLFAQSKTFTVDSFSSFKHYKLGSEKSLYVDSLFATGEKNLYRITSSRQKTIFGDTLHSCLLRFDMYDKLKEIIFVYDVIPMSAGKDVLKEKVEKMYSRIRNKLNSNPKDLTQGKNYTYSWVGNNNLLNFEIQSGVDYEKIFVPGEIDAQYNVIVRKITLKVL